MHKFITASQNNVNIFYCCRIGGGGFVAPGGARVGGTGGGFNKNYGNSYYGANPTFGSSYGR